MKQLMNKIAVAAVMLTTLMTGDVFAQIGIDDLGGLDSTGVNTVFTSIPFLRINPDARSGGMGEVGIATSADIGAIYHNGSKLAFAQKPMSVGLTYTPWLRELVDDIYIAHLAGYKKIDDLSTIGGSLRYFSLGNIQFTDISGASNGDYAPNEFAVDLAYARKLSDNFSAGITLKYVRSDLARGQEVGSGNIVRAANAVAADVSFFYKNDQFTLGDRDAKFSLGGAITNIGNKVAYTEDDVRDFIPINLGLGSALDLEIDTHNKLTFAFDVNKLMVPTPDPSITDIEDPNHPRQKPLLSGMFGSFADAPGGGGEELKELMYSFGVEYWYDNQFAVRAGHFNEHSDKGNRKYVTLGLGLRYTTFGLNFSYILPTTNQRNPLDNTLRFGLTFDFDEE